MTVFADALNSGSLVTILIVLLIVLLVLAVARRL